MTITKAGHLRDSGLVHTVQLDRDTTVVTLTKEAPLGPDPIDELRWYFEQARSHPTPSRSDDLDERFYRARTAFSAPRFKALYRMWKQDGDVALAEIGSHVISRCRDRRLRPGRDPRARSPLRSSLPLVNVA